MLICCHCAENGYANEFVGNELVEGSQDSESRNSTGSETAPVFF